MGHSSALSDDGAVLALGANGASGVKILNRAESGLYEHAETVTGADIYHGTSVGLSSNGEYLVVGNWNVGRGYIYRRVNGLYVLQKTLSGTSIRFGSSASISADGMAVVVGDYGGKLVKVATGTSENPHSVIQTLTSASTAFGQRVRVSKDASVLVVSSYDAKSVWIYHRASEGHYVHTQAFLNYSSTQFGLDIYLSGDNTKLVIAGANWTTYFNYTEAIGGVRTHLSSVLERPPPPIDATLSWEAAFIRLGPVTLPINLFKRHQTVERGPPTSVDPAAK